MNPPPSCLDFLARLDASLTQVYLTGRVIERVYMSPPTVMSLIMWDAVSMETRLGEQFCPYLVRTIVGPLPISVAKELADDIFVLGLRA